MDTRRLVLTLGLLGIAAFAVRQARAATVRARPVGGPPLAVGELDPLVITPGPPIPFGDLGIEPAADNGVRGFL